MASSSGRNSGEGRVEDGGSKPEGSQPPVNIYSEILGAGLSSPLVDLGRADEDFSGPVRLDLGDYEMGDGHEIDIEADIEDINWSGLELNESWDGEGEEGLAQGGSLETSSEGDPDFDISKYMCRASDLVEDYITVGCPEMDEFLKGGFPAFGITEMYGEAGTGKTQICLQLAILAQLSKEKGGLDSGVLYICTEEGFPSPRLNELAFHIKNRFPGYLPENPMDNIFVEHLESADDLMECLDVKLEALARKSSKRIRLVILDSVAGIFRNMPENVNWEERANGLRQLAQTLHEFSYDHKAAIVVCNQVTADLKSGGNIAALGLAWRTLTTTRIRLTKYEKLNQRKFEISVSPHLPTSSISFVIEAEGVRAVT